MTPTAEQNGPWCRYTGKRRRFIYALLGCSGDAEATFRENGEERSAVSIAPVYFHAYLGLVSHLEPSAEGECQPRLRGASRPQRV